MQFDQFTIVLAMLQPDAPALDEEAADALQDAHMAFLADLHEARHLLAGGPLDDPEYRGLSIMNVDRERALELRGRDPAVLAGRLSLKAIRVDRPGWSRPLHTDAVPPVGRRGDRGGLTGDHLFLRRTRRMNGIASCGGPGVPDRSWRARRGDEPDVRDQGDDDAVPG